MVFSLLNGRIRRQMERKEDRSKRTANIAITQGTSA